MIRMHISAYQSVASGAHTNTTLPMGPRCRSGLLSAFIERKKSENNLRTASLEEKPLALSRLSSCFRISWNSHVRRSKEHEGTREHTSEGNAQ